MAQTKIQWTEATWNPITGCNKVSPGCKNCYAEIMHKRLMKMSPEKYSQPFLKGAKLHDPSLEIPLHWKKSKMIFVNSMSDLFHKDVPFEFIKKVWDVMASTPQHTYQVLTKRVERALDFAEWMHKKGNVVSHKNIWMGASVESQEYVFRIEQLIEFPAQIRIISAEPLLGKLDIEQYLIGGSVTRYYNIHWVICGGESGWKARPMKVDRARDLRDQCQRAGVPFFFKQWGTYCREDQMKEEIFVNVCQKGIKTKHYDFDGDNNFHYYKIGEKLAGNILDGKIHNEYPRR